MGAPQTGAPATVERLTGDVRGSGGVGRRRGHGSGRRGTITQRSAGWAEARRRVLTSWTGARPSGEGERGAAGRRPLHHFTTPATVCQAVRYDTDVLSRCCLFGYGGASGVGSVCRFRVSFGERTFAQMTRAQIFLNSYGKCSTRI